MQDRRPPCERPKRTETLRALLCRRQARTQRRPRSVPATRATWVEGSKRTGRTDAGFLIGARHRVTLDAAADLAVPRDLDRHARIEPRYLDAPGRRVVAHGLAHRLGRAHSPRA